MPSQTQRSKEASEGTYSSDAWVPTVTGDTLEGEVISLERGWSDYRGDFYPILRVAVERCTVGGEEVEGNVRAFHAFRTVALSQVLSKRPVTGERVTIVYQGPREKKSRDKFENTPVGYAVTVHGRGAEADNSLYDRLEGDSAH